MRATRALRMTACAAVIVATASLEARAGFTYTSSSSTPVVTSGSLGDSLIGLGSVSSANTLTTPTLVNLLNVTDTTSTDPSGPTDIFTISFNATVSLTNLPSPGTLDSGDLTFSGTLSFTRSDLGGEVSTFALTDISGPTIIGEITYVLSDVSYTAPTVNSTNGAGNISGLITSIGTSTSSTPEPASVAMLGIGLAGVAGFAARRRALVRD